MKSFTITKNDAGQRASKFLEKAVPALPKSLLHKYLRIKRIKRNGKRCAPEDMLQVGDILELYINDEFFGEGRQDFLFLKAPSQVDVVYEDENILLVDKKPGLVVHEDDLHTVDTLIHRILHYLYDKKEYNPASENSFVPSLCNRIDRNTGGLVIAAKNAEALRIMNQKVKDREITKLYLCLVHGTPEPPETTLKDFLLKDSATNQVKVYSRPVPNGRTILTHYRTLQSNGVYSLLEVNLLTGRTHQIRAHLAYYGHPLVGDAKYGMNKKNQGTGFRHQALYAYKLRFDFATESGCLAYLAGKEFQVKQVAFTDFIQQRKGR